MTYRIDRDHLPKPWANPLIFSLSDGLTTIDAEIEQNAAIEYQSAWRGTGLALALSAQRQEHFILAVEDAVARQSERQKRYVFKWADLYPTAKLITSPTAGR